MFKLSLVIILSFLNFEIYAQKIIELNTQKTMQVDQLLKGDLDGKTIVIGEYHYNKKILKAHADIIWELVTRENLQYSFTVGWEFLEYKYATEIESAFEAWQKSQITDLEYLKSIFPNSKNPQTNLPYLDFMAATAKLGGKLVATNATRETKKILMEQGIDALSNADRPTFDFLGSKEYFKRFKAVMGNHVPANLLKKYFSAQVYTDNIIGSYLEKNQVGQTSFLIIGSFHSDYNDGVVKYLKRYSSNEVITLKIVNKNELTTDQLNTFKSKHPEFGYVADYLVIVE